MRLMSSTGRPTEVSTINIVTRPALGILAAPILAQVAVKLKHGSGRRVMFMYRENALWTGWFQMTTINTSREG